MIRWTCVLQHQTSRRTSHWILRRWTKRRRCEPAPLKALSAQNTQRNRPSIHLARNEIAPPSTLHAPCCLCFAIDTPNASTVSSSSFL
eukprot:3886949-Rhodomonas_salina.1